MNKEWKKYDNQILSFPHYNLFNNNFDVYEHSNGRKFIYVQNKSDHKVNVIVEVNGLQKLLLIEKISIDEIIEKYLDVVSLDRNEIIEELTDIKRDISLYAIESGNAFDYNISRIEDKIEELMNKIKKDLI